MPEAIPYLKRSTFAGVVDVVTESLRQLVLYQYFRRKGYRGNTIQFRLRDVTAVAADNTGWNQPAHMAAQYSGRLIEAEPLKWAESAALTNEDMALFASWQQLATIRPEMAPQLQSEVNERLTDLAQRTVLPVREGIHRLMAEALQGSVAYRLGGVTTTTSYGLTDLSGTAISASWATASTKILSDIAAIKRLFRAAAKVDADTVFCHQDLFDTYFQANTEFVSYVQASPRLAEAFLGQPGSGAIQPNSLAGVQPVQMMGLTWVPVPGTYVDRDGTTQQRWPTGKLSVAALNVGDGTPTLEWGSIASIEQPNAMAPTSRTRSTQNPDGYHVDYIDNGVPIIRVPERVCTVDIVP